MHLSPEPTEWMFPKYGKLWKPYTIKILLENKVSGDDGQFDKGSNAVIRYEYVLVNSKKGLKNEERKPARQFLIETPNNYKGQLGATGNNIWAGTETVHVVNGFVNKADGNFELDFRYQAIEDTGVLIGSYPMTEYDCVQVKNAGAQTTLDIQSTYRSVDAKEESAMFRKLGMHYVLSPVSDVDESIYVKDAFTAALKLENLVYDQNQTVFLHDFTSISRAPTVLLIWFAVMCRHPAWKNLDELESYLKRIYIDACPNMRIVQMALDHNQDYHRKCQIRFEDDEKAKRANKDEAKRLNQLTAAQEEAEILKYKRLAEAEAEAIRLQRAKFADDENARLKKLEAEQKERERLADERLKAHLKKMKELEELELARAANRKIKVEKQRLEDEQMRKNWDDELALARKKRDEAKIQVQLLLEKKAKEHDELLEEEKQRLFRIEKDMMERHQRDIEEQEAAEKERLRKRAEDEEQQRLREIKLITLREQHNESELEVEQLLELIKIKEQDIERYNELDRRRRLEMEARRAMEEQRRRELQRQIEFEREQKAIREAQEKKRAEEDQLRMQKILKA